MSPSSSATHNAARFRQLPARLSWIDLQGTQDLYTIALVHWQTRLDTLSPDSQGQVFGASSAKRVKDAGCSDCIERGCPGGEICISRQTAEHLDGHYKCEFMGRFEYNVVPGRT